MTGRQLDIERRSDIDKIEVICCTIDAWNKCIILCTVSIAMAAEPEVVEVVHPNLGHKMAAGNIPAAVSYVAAAWVGIRTAACQAIRASSPQD